MITGSKVLESHSTAKCHHCLLFLFTIVKTARLVFHLSITLPTITESSTLPTEPACTGKFQEYECTKKAGNSAKEERIKKLLRRSDKTFENATNVYSSQGLGHLNL